MTDNLLTTDQQPIDNWPTTYWQLTNNLPTNDWQPIDNWQTTYWQLTDNLLTTDQQPTNKWLTTYWQLTNNILTTNQTTVGPPTNNLLTSDQQVTDNWPTAWFGPFSKRLPCTPAPVYWWVYTFHKKSWINSVRRVKCSYVDTHSTFAKDRRRSSIAIVPHRCLEAWVRQFEPVVRVLCWGKMRRTKYDMHGGGNCLSVLKFSWIIFSNKFSEYLSTA